MAAARGPTAPAGAVDRAIASKPPQPRVLPRRLRSKPPRQPRLPLVLRRRPEPCSSPGALSTVNSTTLTARGGRRAAPRRSEEHTSELQSRGHLVCRLLPEKKK